MSREVVVSIHIESLDYGPYETVIDVPEPEHGDWDEKRDKTTEAVMHWLDHEAADALVASVTQQFKEKTDDR